MEIEFFSAKDIKINPMKISFILDLRNFQDKSIIQGLLKNPNISHIEVGISMDKSYYSLAYFLIHIPINEKELNVKQMKY